MLWSERRKDIDPKNDAQRRAAFARMDEGDGGGHKVGTRIFPQGKQEFASRITKRVPGGYNVKLDNDNPGSASTAEMFVPDKDVVLASPASSAATHQYAPIVRRAIETGVTSIGQLSKADKSELDKAVSRGWLQKTRDYNYPSAPPKYVVNWDYRQELIDAGILETPKEVRKSWSERQRPAVHHGGEFTNANSVVVNSDSPSFVVKEVNGQHRWVLISSNSYQDRDGEIVTQKALEDDVLRADADGDYGPLLWWHEKSIVLGQCTGNAMHNRMLIEWGTFKSAAIAEKFKQAAGTLGISIGFNHPVSQPDAQGLFHTARRFERSALPHDVASNPLTAIPLIHQEESTMLKEKIDALRKVFGGDEALVNSVISMADTHQKAAEDAGIRTKAKMDDDEKKPAADAKPNGEDAADDKPFTKDEATDEEDPKKAKKEYVGDMDPATLKHILTEIVDSRMTTLKAELQTQLDTAATTKAASEAAYAESVKSLDSKLDGIAASAKSALDGVAELKGELPRRLGERLKGYHPSTDGDEPDESFKDKRPVSDTVVDKFMASLGVAPQ